MALRHTSHKPTSFQSLKRDHSSSDSHTHFLQHYYMVCFNRSSATIPLPTLGMSPVELGKQTSFNRSSATIPLPTLAIVCLHALRVMFQSLKRDHSSSDSKKPQDAISDENVSIAQARPFLFRLASPVASLETRWFQSLKRDHSSSDSRKEHRFPATSKSFQSLKRDHSSSDARLVEAPSEAGLREGLREGAFMDVL